MNKTSKDSRTLVKKHHFSQKRLPFAGWLFNWTLILLSWGIVGAARADLAFNIANGDVAGLTNAINACNSDPNDENATINLATNGTYTLSNPLPVFTNLNVPVTLNGNSATLQRANGSESFAVMHFIGVTITITNLTISQGLSDGLYAEANIINILGTLFITGSRVTLSGCNLINNSPAAIGSSLSHLTIENCSFTNNTGGANHDGGAISLDAGSATITGSNFTSNSGEFGGAIEAVGQAVLTITACTFSSNSGFFGSGAIGLSQATLTADNCTFQSNSAPGGGAVQIGTHSSATITDSSFSSNSAGDGGGGAIQQVDGPSTLTVSGSIFSTNQAHTGGAFDNEPCGSTATITNCTFYSNNASNIGGAVYNSGGDPNGSTPQNSTANIINCTFATNTARFFGNSVANNYATSGSTPANATLSLVNTILTGSPLGSGGFGSFAGETSNSGGQFTSLGHNLCDDSAGGDTGHGSGGLLTGPGDIRNTTAQLASSLPQNNGGPTDTFRLKSISLAVDAGDPANAPSRDQRGYIRNGTADIGACEFNGLTFKIDGITTDNAGDVILAVEVVKGLIYDLQMNFDLSPNGWFTNSGQAPPITATGNDTEQLVHFSATHEFSGLFYRVTTP